MNIITQYFARRRNGKRLAELCRQTLLQRAQKRSQAAMRGNKARQHYDSSKDCMCQAACND